MISIGSIGPKKSSYPPQPSRTTTQQAIQAGLEELARQNLIEGELYDNTTMTDAGKLTLSGLECCPPADENDLSTPPCKPPHWTVPAVLAIFGGLNNGYNLVVVAEILGDLRSEKILTSPIQEGIFVASINVGIVAMLPLGAYLSDTYGRLPTVVIGESVVVLAAILQIFCSSAITLTLTRTVVGFGMALCVLLKPLYIAELAHRDHRGKLLIMFSVAFSTGLLIVSVVSAFQQEGARNWRLLLGVGAIPSLVLILAAQFYLVESPVWLDLVRARRNEQEHEEEDDPDVATGLTTGETVPRRQRPSPPRTDSAPTPGSCCTVLLELFDSNHVGGTMLTMFLLGLMYELDGMWMLVQYRNDVLDDVVSSKTEMHKWAIALCATIFVVSFVPMLLVDRIGRRPFLIVGVIGSTLSKLTFAIFSSSTKGWPMAFLLLVWAGFSQMGIGCMANVIVSEVFGPRHRSVGMCFIYWTMLSTGMLMSLAYRPLQLVIGNQGWVYVFTFASVLLSVPVILRLPETAKTEIGEVTT